MSSQTEHEHKPIYKLGKILSLQDLSHETEIFRFPIPPISFFRWSVAIRTNFPIQNLEEKSLLIAAMKRNWKLKAMIVSGRIVAADRISYKVPNLAFVENWKLVRAFRGEICLWHKVDIYIHVWSILNNIELFGRVQGQYQPYCIYLTSVIIMSIKY